MIIKCLIVDDEKNAHYVLKNYIERHDRLQLVGQCYQAESAIVFIDQHEVDLIFLDINMPVVDGFEFIQKLNKEVKIILTTAYAEFALKAFDHGVLDYLVKPIPYERFEQAIRRCQQETADSLPVIEDQNERIPFKVNQETLEFVATEIFYVQSWGNYIKLYTREATYLCSSTTVDAERKLPKAQFIRIHKSYIVSIDEINSFHIDKVLMKSGEELPVGITYRRILSEVLQSSEQL